MKKSLYNRFPFNLRITRFFLKPLRVFIFKRLRKKANLNFEANINLIHEIVKKDAYLSHGTALTLTRDNKMLDTDIDSTALVGKEEVIINRLNKMNINYKILIVDGMKMQLKIEMGNSNFDVFFLQKHSSEKVKTYGCAYVKGKLMKASLPFRNPEFKDVKLFGKMFMMPGEKYLSDMYGSDYMTPNSDWDFVTMPKENPPIVEEVKTYEEKEVCNLNRG